MMPWFTMEHALLQRIAALLFKASSVVPGTRTLSLIRSNVCSHRRAVAARKQKHSPAAEPVAGRHPSELDKPAGKSQERESSDSPMLNAFCRVAPSVLLNFLAIFAAAVFFFANVFSSRTSVAVQARRFFDFLAINPPFQERQ
jgi:hypothetical protein